MITISCPIKHDFIIESLETSQLEDITFKFVDKNGIKLNFAVDGDEDEAIALAKQIIKSTEMGSVLYFQISKS